MDYQIMDLPVFGSGTGEGLGVHIAGESWEVVRLVDSDLADHKRALLKKKGLPNPPESVWQELLESFEG